MEASDQTSAGTSAQDPAELPATDSPPTGAATGEGAPADSSGQSAPPTPPEQDPATTYPPPSADEPQPPDEPDEDFEAEQATAAAVQSPAERQTVPEVRPQSFVSDPLGGSRSDTQQREIDSQTGAAAPAMGQEAYDAANSDENKKAALDESKLPNLYPGQRVQIISGDNQGRNAYVVQALYEDAVQAMIASAGVAESRFAEVTGYIVQTRDGRTDRLEVKPDEIRTLEVTDGWGRGQI